MDCIIWNNAKAGTWDKRDKVSAAALKLAEVFRSMFWVLVCCRLYNFYYRNNTSIRWLFIVFFFFGGGGVSK